MFISQEVDRKIDSATNLFVMKTGVKDNCSDNNSTSVTINQLLNNELAVYWGTNNENRNLELYDCELLVIDDFQDCNGKEATQSIIFDLLQYRINKGLFTYLLSDCDYSDLKYISRKLNDLIIDNFKLF